MSDDKHEKRRKKQRKKMGKIVAQAWKLGDDFHDDLTAIGSKLDSEAYKVGRHGWDDYAKDLGAVYNHHIHK